MFARVTVNSFSNTSINFTKLNSFTIEIYPWYLNFAKNLEEKRFRVLNKDLEVFFD